jgi:hypothetical protein
MNSLKIIYAAPTLEAILHKYPPSSQGSLNTLYQRIRRSVSKLPPSYDALYQQITHRIEQIYPALLKEEDIKVIREANFIIKNAPSHQKENVLSETKSLLEIKSPDQILKELGCVA